MTRASAIADILKKLGDAHYQAADELVALAADDSPAPVSAGRPEVVAIPPVAPPASFDSSDYEDGPQGSERMCPIHKMPMKPKPFDPNLWGCTQQGKDPAWTNQKGYCTLTDKNVGTYLRQRTAVA